MKINIEHKLDSLTLKAGDMFTIYLQNDKGQTIQVELRVMPDGEPQVFLKDKYMNIIHEFENWMPMTTEY